MALSKSRFELRAAAIEAVSGSKSKQSAPIGAGFTKMAVKKSSIADADRFYQTHGIQARCLRYLKKEMNPNQHRCAMVEDASANPKPDFTEIVAAIVSAYVSNNSLPVAELPELIVSMHSVVSKLSTSLVLEKVVAAPQEPAVSIKKSVTHDFIICLEDGKKFKSLKRHLMRAYGLTPDAYRAKWGLPRDYPMVAPGYAATRSQLAKQIGLGKKGGMTKKSVTPASRTARKRRQAA